jgi:acyl transferase domain-containing protein/acyl carrier protein
LVGYLKQEFRRILRLSTEDLEPTTNFMDLGFDSILALQIRKSLCEASGAELESTVLFRYPSVAELARFLADSPVHAAAFAKLVNAPNRVKAISESQTEVESAGDLRLDETTHTVDADEIAQGTSHQLATTSPTTVTLGQLAATEASSDTIAVIGMACRFPGAASVEEFWDNLRRGVDSVREIPPSRWDWRATYDPSGQSQGSSRSKWGGFVEGVDEFDPGFFQISPHEARLMDPQQRLFLEVAWEALERAGYRPDQLAGRRCGVFVGVNASDYGTLLHESGEATDPHLQSGNAVSLVATRVSYLLNFRGPSLTVDTACSSALVAVHLACQSLRSGEAEMAVAGGVNLILNPAGMVLVSQFGMLAADGRCKAFDEQADGFVRGEGAAAVLLKPLSKALADGDQVIGVLRGMAINNDGHSKAGLAAPNPKAQEEVIAEAHRNAGVEPETICYLEAHGTGTALGDPIELDGLTHAFGRRTSSRGYCAIGSVKSNVGHLEAAAGIAGLIKALLVVQQGELPPTLHVTQPNRNIRFEASPFFVNDRLRAWPIETSLVEIGQLGSEAPCRRKLAPQPGVPRRAGVSAFGFGGTNVHAIVEQAPPREFRSHAPARAVQVLTLSAGSKSALRRLGGAFQQYLSTHDDWSLEDVCLTANAGRKPCDSRLAIVLRYREQLADKLELFRLATDAAMLERAGVFFASVKAEADELPMSKQQVVGEIQTLENRALELIARTCHGQVVDDLVGPWLRTRGLSGTDHASTFSPTLWQQLNVEQQSALANLVALLFVMGADVHWDELYGTDRWCRVLLPTYPFERRRCWVSGGWNVSSTFTFPHVTGTSAEAGAPAQRESSANNVSPELVEAPTRKTSVLGGLTNLPSADRFLYQPIWRPQLCPARAEFAAAVDDPTMRAIKLHRGLKAWLVVGYQDEFSRGICNALRSLGRRVIEARPGTKFAIESNDVVTFDPARRKHWRRLNAKLADWQADFDQVVLLWPAQEGAGTDSTADIPAIAERHAIRLVRVVQAMLETQSPRTRVLRLVTRGSQSVMPGQPVAAPASATIWGLALSIEREHPQLQVQCTDSDPVDHAATSAEHLVREWLSTSADQQVAFRAGRRYVFDIQPLDLLSVGRRSSPLRRGGVYLVTGGLGGIGLAVAGWLASKYQAKLILAGRHVPPSRGERSSWLATHPQRAAWRRKLEWLDAIEVAAEQVELRTVDMADAGAVRHLIDGVCGQFGQIDGVFHAAGVLDDGPVESVSSEQLAAVLRPKLVGACTLGEALADTPDVPCVYFSSVAGLLGSPQQASYAAANRGLDALASGQHGRGQRAVSIDWGLWGEVGMGVAVVDRVRQSGVLEPLETAVAIAALERVLSFDLCQAIIAHWGMVGWNIAATDTSRKTPAVVAANILPGTTSQAGNLGAPARPALTIEQAERALIARVARLLELDESEVARHQTFAEIGMDSILVVQLLRELEGWLGRTFSPTLLRDYPNVAALAKLIAG